MAYATLDDDRLVYTLDSVPDADRQPVAAPREQCQPWLCRIVDDPVEDPRWSRSVGPASGGVGLPLARLAERAATDLRLRAVRGDDIAGLDAGERSRGVPRQGLDVAPAGVAAVLGSLRSAGGRTGRPVRDARAPDRRARTAGWRLGGVAPASRRSIVRERSPRVRTASPAAEYCLHRLDLRPEATEIFRRIPSLQRSGPFAARSARGSPTKTGTSDRLLASFYRLLRMTRRRHRLPPQPLAWFRNLLTNLGDGIAIHVASKDGEPIASILTLSFKKTMYLQVRRVGCGASSPGRHAVPVLAGDSGCAGRGFEELDLGRSDLDQPGLIAFKEHLGATQSTLTYYRYPAEARRAARSGWMSRVARGMFAYLPDAALDLAGQADLQTPRLADTRLMSSINSSIYRKAVACGGVPAGPAGRAESSGQLRVCHLAYTFYETDNRVRRYAEALAERGHSVDVIALRRDGQPTQAEHNGVRVHRLQRRRRTEGAAATYLAKIMLFFARATALISTRHIADRTMCCTSTMCRISWSSHHGCRS